MHLIDAATDNRDSYLSPSGRRSIVVQSVSLNVLIVGVMFLGHYLPTAASVAVAILIIGLCIKALVCPMRTFFLLFGIKLTYDSLWFVAMPLSSRVTQPLVLFLIPVLVVLLTGPRMPPGRHTRFVMCAVAYLGWVVLAQALNQRGVDVEIATRQASMVVGMALGFKYVRSRDAADMLCLLFVASAALPVLLAMLQLVYPGAVIFHAKAEAIREFRPSGIYYDAGTAGTVYLIALACSIHLSVRHATPGRLKQCLAVLIVSSVAAILAGGTLSMLVAMCFALSVLGAKSVYALRSPVAKGMVLAGIGLAVWVVCMTSVPSPIQRKLAVEYERVQQGTYRGGISENAQLFSGRMGLWQEAWTAFEQGNVVQQLFGLGMSGSHSTYVHLLVQIGIAGLVFYLLLHLWIAFELVHLRHCHVAGDLAIVSMGWMLLIGISLTTVLFTSFQWFVYLLVAAVLNAPYAPARGQRWQYAQRSALGSVRPGRGVKTPTCRAAHNKLLT